MRFRYIPQAAKLHECRSEAQQAAAAALVRLLKPELLFATGTSSMYTTTMGVLVWCFLSREAVTPLSPHCPIATAAALMGASLGRCLLPLPSGRPNLHAQLCPQPSLICRLALHANAPLLRALRHCLPYS